MIDAKLLDILVCPICKGKLIYRKEISDLVCKLDRLSFPIKDGIPMMIESEAREISSEERESL